MDVTEILRGLEELDKVLICIVCSSSCKNSVRIKICGHYFCKACLIHDKITHTCPKCKLPYKATDLDYDNIAKSTEKYITQLKSLLNNKAAVDLGVATKTAEELNDKNLDLVTKRNNEDVTIEMDKYYSEDCIIAYNNEKYHINFVDKLHTKLNNKGESLLHIACKKGNIENVRRFITEKQDLNIKDYAGWAPLHEAVESQHIPIVELLVSSGALINIPGIEYVTPLHKAVYNNNADMVTVLLKYGADVNAMDYNGLRPIESTTNRVTIDLLGNHAQITKKIVTREVFLCNKLSVYCHSVENDYKSRLKSCKHIKIEDEFDIKKKITHMVIKRTHKPSFKILAAMLMGVHFYPQEAVDSYVKMEYFLPIPQYVFIYDKRLNKGIRKAMMNSILKHPKLFDGINFYIEGHANKVTILNLAVDKGYLTKLIIAGGGNTLHRPPAVRTCENSLNHSFHSDKQLRCCNYIIYEKNNEPELTYNMSELQHKTSEWLIHCIIDYEIC